MNTIRYLEADAAWLLTAPSSSRIEILAAGSPSEPNPQRLALLQNVIENLPDVTMRAVAYLDEFVDRQKFANGSDWFLEGISSILPANAETEFTLQFSIEGDTYGLWAVDFKMELSRHWPIAFSRRNY